MSTETAAPVKENNGKTAQEMLAEKGVPSELTVSRNGVNWKFIPVKLKKKDQTAADKFSLVPEKPKTWTDELKQQFLTFVGIDQASLIAFARVRQMSTNWFVSSLAKDTGMFVEAAFGKAVDTFSLRGETISALQDELDDLQEELIECSKDQTVSAADRVKRFTEIAARMSEIKDTIETKKRASKDTGEE